MLDDGTRRSVGRRLAFLTQKNSHCMQHVTYNTAFCHHWSQSVTSMLIRPAYSKVNVWGLFRLELDVAFSAM